MKRCLVLLFVSLMFVSSLFSYSVERDENTLNVDNEGFFNLSTTYGASWDSAAVNTNVGGVRLKGTLKVKAQSLFSAIAIEPETGKKVTLNSGASKDITSKDIENGVEFRFGFDSIAITVQIVLSDNGVEIIIPTSLIEESEEYFVSEINILPQLGHASLLDEGYVVIPDGSGAVMSFNNGRTGIYREDVYGLDPVFEKIVTLSRKAKVTIPAFVMVMNGDSLISYVTEGGGIVSIYASPSSSFFPFNSVSFIFTLRHSQEESIQKDASKVVYESPRLYNGNLSVLLIPVEGDDIALSAKKLRDLLPERSYKYTGPVVTFEYAERERFKLLSIPLWMRNRTILTQEQFYESLDIFSEGTTFIFRDWDSSSLSGGLSKKNAVGIDRRLEKMESDAVLNGIDVIYEKNIASLGSSSSKTIRDISGMRTGVFNYLPQSGYKDEESIRYLLSPSYLERNDDEMYLFSTIGEMLWSDYNQKSSASRNETMESIRSLLSDGDYAVTGGLWYSLDNAVLVVDGPDGSNMSNVFDMEIPFYEMVLSGRTGVVSKPINLSENYKNLVLKIFLNVLH